MLHPYHIPACGKQARSTLLFPDLRNCKFRQVSKAQCLFSTDVKTEFIGLLVPDSIPARYLGRSSVVVLSFDRSLSHYEKNHYNDLGRLPFERQSGQKLVGR